MYVCMHFLRLVTNDDWCHECEYELPVIFFNLAKVLQRLGGECYEYIFAKLAIMTTQQHLMHKIIIALLPKKNRHFFSRLNNAVKIKLPKVPEKPLTWQSGPHDYLWIGGTWVQIPRQCSYRTERKIILGIGNTKTNQGSHQGEAWYVCSFKKPTIPIWYSIVLAYVPR
jgi:hypothetical protein